jgi:hypothetical protein
MNDVVIIIHDGTVCLLPKPETVGDDVYPFGFDANKPEKKSWSFRLLRSSSGRAHLDNGQLKELLKASPRELNAKWEEQVKHSTGWVTIYPVPKDGKAGDPLKAEFEKGPELEMQPTKPEVEEPDPLWRPLPTPRPKPPEIEMSF